MYFLLKSEVEIFDNQKNYYKKRVYCPVCNKTQLKKLDSNNFYNRYQCWNKKCSAKKIPFIVLNDYIQNEDHFNDKCDSCDEPLHRDFISEERKDLILYFKCKGKLCESHLDPFRYNLIISDWEGKTPNFTFYDDLQSASNQSLQIREKIQKEVQIFERKESNLIEDISNDFQVQELEQEPRENHIIEEIPLLTMTSAEYNDFLNFHQDKVVVLVDLPNFVRTLRGLYPHNFEDVLRKAHEFILQYIENSFHASDDFIIRYFSKPAKDLEVPNSIIIKFCFKNPNKEIFHLLKVSKGAGYSDIDNYLITNGVEILERCSIRGFVIVSSDKDFLPVMRIASYKKIKSHILGINTPEIYEKYNIEDITFLGIMKFFDR